MPTEYEQKKLVECFTRAQVVYWQSQLSEIEKGNWKQVAEDLEVGTLDDDNFTQIIETIKGA